MNEKTHLDLFSGIGGFALAARWNGYRTLGFCDNEPYAQAVLKKHWPEVPCHKDIREVRGELYAGVTLLTGGFPCQPFSVAGKQRGKDDNRYLWPEMLRVIQEAKPTWIIGENVAGIVNLALDQVCADLEGQGYEVEPIIVPACAVDAPHRRERVWILANANSYCDSREKRGVDAEKIRLSEENREEWSGGWMPSGTSQMEQGRKSSRIHDKANVADSNNKGLQGYWGFEECESKLPVGEGCSSEQKEWLAEPNVGRLAHGVPNRVAKLRGLGNAIVPQVAAEIIRCINKIMEDNK